MGTKKEVLRNLEAAQKKEYKERLCEAQQKRFDTVEFAENFKLTFLMNPFYEI